MFYKMGDIFTLGYDAGERSRMRRDLGWGRMSPRDEENMVGKDNTREMMRQKASDLRRNNAVVAGVCERLALWTVGPTGIIPQARTKDKTWNRDAEDFWKEYSAVLDSRKRSTMWDFQNMSVSLRPTHGGIYFQKLEDGTIRPVEPERIRQPSDGEKAKAFCDGVRVDEFTGEIKAFCVHTRDKDGGFTANHDERMIDSRDMLRVIKPTWRADQVREIPDLAPVIPTLQDIHELCQYVLNTAKNQSQYIGFLKKMGGSGMNAFPRGSTPSPTKRQTFKQEWGEILEGLPGDDLEFKSSPTPNTSHIPYLKMQLALCSSALSMPYEFFTLDLSGLDFSRQKGMLLLVNFACRPWKQWLIQSFLQPLWNWRVAMEMKPGRALAPAPTDEGISTWNHVEWQSPEEPWIDRQEAQQSDVLEIQAGLLTLGAAAKRRGRDLEDTLRDKAKEQKLIEDIAAETGISAEKLSFMQIPGQVMENQKPGENKDKKELKDEADTDND
jgi:lambda family phage portal protein